MPETRSKKLEQIINFLKEKVDGKAILACSGGNDSSLLSVICNMALGEKVISVFIDSGLLRKGERQNVEEFFKSYNINYRIYDESEKFIERLKNITDPEKKRKIIGNTFIEVFEKIAEKEGAEFLIQGTIAPDWIESGGKHRDTIKSHHNVGGLPEKMKLKLVEPLRDLYKDDVREISEELKLNRRVQPFPGPGLAVRIIGEVNRQRLDLLRDITEIVEKTIEEKYSFEKRPWQYFAILLPVKTTGVHGDKRSYGETVAIRAINTTDGMTATASEIPWETLQSISVEITNSCPEINRVVYDITDKPPATIEWE